MWKALEMLGGVTLTDAERAAIDAEFAGEPLAMSPTTSRTASRERLHARHGRADLAGTPTPACEKARCLVRSRTA
jgi:hypothetical protein